MFLKDEGQYAWACKAMYLGQQSQAHVPYLLVVKKLRSTNLDPTWISTIFFLL
jgi:hypothetical protein